MSGQIIPLRLLNTSTSRMRLGPLRNAVLGKVFPYKMPYTFASMNSTTVHKSVVSVEGFTGVRGFSSFRGGGFKSRGVGGAAKSLVEDEAELSDWVSDLRSDKFKGSSNTSVYSDDSGDDRGRGGGRGGGGGYDGFDRSERSGSGRGGRGMSSRGGRGGGSFSASSRRFESDDDVEEWAPRRGGRGRGRGMGREAGGGYMSRGSSRKFDGDSDEDDFPPRRDFGSRGGGDDFGSRRGRGNFGSRGGRGDFGARGGRGDFGSRGGRGGSSSFERNSTSRGPLAARVPTGKFGSTDEDSEDDDERYPKRGGGSRGGLSSRGSRGGRGSDFNGGRGGRGRDFDRGGRSSEFSGGRGGRDRDLDRSSEFSSGRGGRSSNFSNGRGRGGRVIEKSGRGGIVSGRKSSLFSDDDDDDDDDNGEDLLSGFGEVLSEEDSSEDSEKVIDENSEVDEEDDSNDYGAIDSYDEDDESGVKGTTLVHETVKEIKASITPKASSGASESHLSQTRFDQCSVSALSLKGIKDAGYERMTMVQEATLPVILKGKDVLAKAKTGTGKTVAFLLPAIEAIVKLPPVGRDQKRPPINVLVVCPTRELASQAAAEAKTLLKYHPTIGVQVVIGGTKLPAEQKQLQANPCQILVATPGRLKDHIENTTGFAARIMGVKVLILDEADHLLDMGFRKDIERIVAAVPKERQTLLFSATVPPEVRQISHIALKRDHEFINTVQEGGEETHSQVKQSHLIAPLDKQFSVLYALLKEHISDDIDYKVLVFCTTAMVTKLVAAMLSELSLNVREIHSRKPQSYRTKISDEFRKSKRLILVTSDVSARGVDYPDVSLVIQIGAPSDREQYIHRLGRTGRKGKEGQGILVLAPWEDSFLASIKNLPITKATEPLVDPDTKKKVERALNHLEMTSKTAAYQAWLGYYNSHKCVSRDKPRLVQLAAEFSRSMGLDSPPALKKMVVGKMGLKNVPGLKIQG